jgi:predicted amino acid racemase
MKAFLGFLLGGALIAGFSACEKKPQVVEKPTASLSTVETNRVGSAVDAYIASPTEAQAANVERAFSELDSEIAELDQRVSQSSGDEREEARTKSAQLQSYRDKEKARFTEARVRSKVETETSSAGSKIEAAAEKIGDSVKDAAETVKEKLP